MTWSDLTDSERATKCERIHRHLQVHGECVAGTISHATAIEIGDVKAALEAMKSRGAVIETTTKFASKWSAVKPEIRKVAR